MTQRNGTSIKLNTISNYVGQAYAIAVAAIITPFYLQYLGAEAFGLVGFFLVLQNLLNLLDMGLGATLVRQVAYSKGQIKEFKKFPNLLKSFELIFFLLSLTIAVCIYFGKNWIAQGWIKSTVLSASDIAYSISVMGLIIGTRFLSTLYRCGIIGFEDQVWINKFSIIINSLKYVGSLLILVYVTNDIRHFFEYQFVIGVLETIILSRRFYFNLPSFNFSIDWFNIDWSAFREIFPFALGIAYTSTIFMVITQLDKLLLSGILPLEEFGYFSLIALIAGAVLSLSTPVFMAFLPKMTILASKGNLKEMIDVYVDMTQVITWISFSSVVLIGIFSQEILYFLTGNKKAFDWGDEILHWYVLGSGIFVLGTFQYYLQNAIGKLRLYVIGSTFSFAIMVPSMYYVTIEHGALGAAQLWVAFGSIWFLGWTSVVHIRLVPGFHLKWLLRDLLPIVLSVSVLSWLLSVNIYIDMSRSRLVVATEAIIIGVVFLLVTSLGVRSFRVKYLKLIGWNSV